MIRTAFVLAALALAAPAGAATWTVDPAASTLAFTGTQSGQPFAGKFKTWSGSIDYDPARPAAAHVTIAIEMGSATTGDTQRDEALPGDDWFATGQFPKATFEATGFVPKGDAKGGANFETTGRLTIRGIAKEVTLPFSLTIDGGTAHAVGTAKLVRTAFGVGQGAWASGEDVGLAVDVTVDLTAHRTP